MKENKNIKSKVTKTTTKALTTKAPVKASLVKRTARKATAAAVLASTPAATAHAAPVLTAPRREITTELIAQRAYILWEKQGRPHGHDMANWLLAEKQLRQEIHSFTA
jgi:hypothetical protein